MITVNKGIYFSIKFKNLFSSVICLMATASYLLLILSFYIGVDSNEAASNVSVISTLPLIIIDPGHGGEDGGTSSADGIIEKDINLSISRKLDILLTLCGYNTLMTRNEDKLIYSGSHKSMRSKKVSDIRNRLSVIENNPESVFLSIFEPAGGSLSVYHPTIYGLSLYGTIRCFTISSQNVSKAGENTSSTPS